MFNKTACTLYLTSDLLATRGAIQFRGGLGWGDLVREMVVEGAADLADFEELDDLAQTRAARAE